MRMEIHNAEDAVAVDEYFNGFHDGFIASFEARSHDRFELDGRGQVGHAVTGAFDVRLVVAHYNYGGKLQPPGRRLAIDCAEAQEIVFDLREVPAESWPLISLEFVPLRDGTGRLGVEVVRHHLVGSAWETRHTRLLTCAAAAVEELADPV